MSKDKLRAQLKQKSPFGSKEAKQAVGDASQAAHPEGVRDPTETAGLAAQERQEGINTGLDPVAGAQAGVSTLQAQASGNIPDEQKDRAKQYKTRTQEYLKGKMPKERREQTIWRLKKMVVEIQGHQDCEYPLPLSRWP